MSYSMAFKLLHSIHVYIEMQTSPDSLTEMNHTVVSYQHPNGCNSYVVRTTLVLTATTTHSFFLRCYSLENNLFFFKPLNQGYFATMF